MSKRKDRERAESGVIFRDGRLMTKEEWNTLNSTREEQAAKQEGVDKAVATHMAALPAK